MDPFNDFGELLQYVENNYSNPTTFNDYRKGKWEHTSSEKFVQDVKNLACGLIHLGLRKGDKVGILAEPSSFWVIADFAIILAGGVSVPLFSTISDENFVYEVAQAQVRSLFVHGHSGWKMYHRHRNLFEQVIGLDDHAEAGGALDLEEVLKLGEEHLKSAPSFFSDLRKTIKGNDVATIIYTSGSAGVSKGVELTHRNLLHLVSQKVFGWKKEESYASILPLAHIFARQINLILIGWGVSIYFINDPSRLAPLCRTFRPTLMIVVPRVLEKIYSKMRRNVQKLGAFKRRIANWAFKLAKDGRDTTLNRLFRPIADFFVYSSLRRAFGTEFRVILCGGAPLDHKLCSFFVHIGFPIYEGWGLTEASTATVNIPSKWKIGTVGVPLPGVTVKVSEEGEVLVGGPTVMRGYYRNPKATEQAIDDKGWLHTGDRGTIDEDGFLTLVGRIKEQYKLSSGEYVSPSPIEQTLCQHPLIDMALVIGEGQRFASCLLFPDYVVLRRWKEKRKAHHLSDEEFLESDFMQNEMEQLLAQVNINVNRWERVYQYRFISAVPTLEGGELTPTMKLKRQVILEKHKMTISDIYGEEAA